MDSFTDFAFNEEYKRLIAVGDKLAEVEALIDWKKFRPILESKKFRPILESMYTNRSASGGRPEADVIVMLKMLILQQWHGLSDQEIEKQCIDRISFRHFLKFPEYIPDSTTVWLFRKRIIDTNKEKEVWRELQRQLDSLGLKIKKGMIQDATFIHSDPGHAGADKPRGSEAKTRRNKDGTWAKKSGKSHFGYKLHTIIDTDYQLIRRFETTTATVHDNKVDLSRENEVVYRDKGYFGSKCCGYDATMQRAVRGRPLGIREILRNSRISAIRVTGERVYAVTKGVFKSGTTLVTTVKRVNLKMLFTAFGFNLYQLSTLRSKGVI
ncbi:transposase IS4 family protein (plasmid) [Methanohalobium evestigatum Z-7303]|uniref:Transposase IS4 family protein n=1 Tax=Methanohalobium evestigatum (strain ATCC BAA-1072 / DSM 3721 / NBRC 107634 / OCM 161 / Z-7303) TaxID=644295 RepID=D7EBW0_METEZ|nr:IS5 family transposase [Methanohalobium evestigatum]ADI75082.1 transposase IS4 family protein [Methanohalobium evestigatum Z-7303]